MLWAKLIGISLLCGLLVFACVRRDVLIREEGRQEVRAEAQALAEANRVKAEKASQELSAKHARSSAKLRKLIDDLRAEKADVCSEANALPGILEALK